MLKKRLNRLVRGSWVSISVICLLLPAGFLMAATAAVDEQQETTIAATPSDVTPTNNVVSDGVHYQHALWEGLPIRVVLPVGQERIIRFPSSVTLHNDNPALTTDKLHILNNAGFLYLRAKQSFAPIRLAFVVQATGAVVLVDISAANNANDTPLAIVLAGSHSNNNPDAINHDHALHFTQETPVAINYVTLMRYAVGQLYSPKRLMPQNAAIHRIPMFTQRNVNLFANAAAMAMPLASWQGGALTVTAILVKNTSKQPVRLDPRTLHGHWLAASIYPSNRLTPSGTPADRSTIFLISNQPFMSALQQLSGYAR